MSNKTTLQQTVSSLSYHSSSSWKRVCAESKSAATEHLRRYKSPKTLKSIDGSLLTTEPATHHEHPRPPASSIVKSRSVITNTTKGPLLLAHESLQAFYSSPLTTQPSTPTNDPHWQAEPAAQQQAGLPQLSCTFAAALCRAHWPRALRGFGARRGRAPLTDATWQCEAFALLNMADSTQSRVEVGLARACRDQDRKRRLSSKRQVHFFWVATRADDESLNILIAVCTLHCRSA